MSTYLHIIPSTHQHTSFPTVRSVITESERVVATSWDFQAQYENSPWNNKQQQYAGGNEGNKEASIKSLSKEFSNIGVGNPHISLYSL